MALRFVEARRFFRLIKCKEHDIYFNVINNFSGLYLITILFSPFFRKKQRNVGYSGCDIFAFDFCRNLHWISEKR